MKGYIISVILVGIIGSVMSVLSPEGEGGGIGKTVKYATGLVLIIVCIAPLSAFLESLNNLDLQAFFDVEKEESEEYESIFDASYGSAEVANTREGIKRILNERFEIDESEVDVSVQVVTDENGARRLNRIFLTLYGSAIWKDTGAIERYLGSLFGCEIVTAVD